MLEAKHNSHRLPCATAVLAKNAIRASKYLDRALVRYVDRGLRIRRLTNKKTNMMYFSARNSEPIRIAIRLIKDAGFVQKVFPNRHVIEME